MATPIFILGWRRSGTTLMANLLSQHSNVVSVQNYDVPDNKSGVFESVYFSHVAGKFGNLKDPNTLIRFLVMFTNSSYFELSGVEKDRLYEARPQSYESIFRIVMDKMAEKEHTDFWLEKSPPHSFHAEEIQTYFSDARFITLKRPPHDQIRSALNLLKVTNVKKKSMGPAQRKFIILKELIAYHGAYKHINSFKKKFPRKIFSIPFEDLIFKREKSMRAICSFLQLEFENQITLSESNPNSSFKNDRERKEGLSWVENLMITLLTRILKCIPFHVYSLIYQIKRRFHGRKLTALFFYTKIRKYGWNDLYLDKEK